MNKEELRKEWRKAVPLTLGVTPVETVADWWIAKLESSLQKKIEDIKKMKEPQDALPSSPAYNLAIDNTLSILMKE